VNDNLKGILAMLASAAGFVTNDATVKFVTQELPNGQIIFLRGLVATALMGLVTSIVGGWRSPVVLFKPAMTIRLAGAALATLFIVAGLRHMPLATANAILQVSPLLVTAGAAILLGAHVGWRRWTASFVGFVGVLLIVQPGMEGFVPEAWLVLAALLGSSTRDLTTRFVDQSVPSIFVTFATSATIMLVGLGLMPFEQWVVPTPRALWLILLASTCLFVAYHFGVVAMRTGEIPVVAPFRYTSVLLALVLGFAIWGYVPDALSMTGIALIVLAGLYLLVCERSTIRKRTETASTTAALGKAKVAS